MTRKLASDEQALWARVVATVKPLRPRPLASAAVAQVTAVSSPRRALLSPPPLRDNRNANANTLDAGWDRRLSRGLAQPDMVVDLHGLGLADAHDLLERRLAEAFTRGDRLILLVTGRLPHPDRRPEGRGVIRASVPGWLSASAYASAIAAVRGAHPRHGGTGALYIVLRRHRDRHRQKS